MGWWMASVSCWLPLGSALLGWEGRLLYRLMVECGLRQPMSKRVLYRPGWCVLYRPGWCVLYRPGWCVLYRPGWCGLRWPSERATY